MRKPTEMKINTGYKLLPHQVDALNRFKERTRPTIHVVDSNAATTVALSSALDAKVKMPMIIRPRG
jgi:hypothetical protein